MPTVEQMLATLTEMGFTEAQAKKALGQTAFQGVEAAMEWLLAHPDDDGNEPAKADDGDEEDAFAAELAEKEEAARNKKPLTDEEKAEQMKR